MDRNRIMGAEIIPHRVMERFPAHWETIKELLKQDKNFQTLCSDYHRCAKALEFWKRADLCEAPQRRQEYEALLAELEAEIVQVIAKAGTTATHATPKGK